MGIIVAVVSLWRKGNNEMGDEIRQILGLGIQTILTSSMIKHNNFPSHFAELVPQGPHVQKSVLAMKVTYQWIYMD